MCLDGVKRAGSSAPARRALSRWGRVGRVMLGGVVALSTLACGGDDPTGLDLLLSFTAERYDPSQGSLPSDAAEGGVGTITVQGGLQTPCLASASDLRGEAAKDGSAVTLDVRLEPEGACDPGVEAFTYEALLGNLGSGTYRLTVSHVFSEGVGYIALQTDVIVR